MMCPYKQQLGTASCIIMRCPEARGALRALLCEAHAINDVDQLLLGNSARYVADPGQEFLRPTVRLLFDIADIDT